MRTFYLLAALILSVIAAQAQGDAAKGKNLFVTKGCYQCHGYDGHGGAGAKLAPRPIAVASLIAYARRPAGAMPIYTAKVISDAELTDIWAYLKSIPDPPAVKDIPLLNQ
jgi:mono/diheme cytochrome c family protein